MARDNIKLRNRFVDDFNLPVSVLDSPYFEYQLKLYDAYNDTYRKWEWLLLLIDEHYGGNENLFLEDYYNCRNKIITNIEESDHYKDFCSTTMERYVVPPNTKFNAIGKTSVYTKTNDRKFFLSIDLKHANFQGLKYHNPALVNYANDYENFLKYNLDFNHPLLEYFNNSRYSRQVIFGKLNMSRNVAIQNYIIYQVYNVVCNYTDNNNIKVHSKQADELIFEVENEKDIIQSKNLFFNIEKLLGDSGIQVNLQFYHLKCFNFETSSGYTFSVYEKNGISNSDNTIRKIKSCPITYFPQVYKLLAFEEICYKMDLVFYYEKNLSKFLSPIKIINKNDN